MSLTNDLNKLREDSFDQLPAEAVQSLKKGIEEVANGYLKTNALNVGDTIPQFELPNIDGERKNIKDIFTKEYLVINFYRGGWCPFCSMELRAYEQIKDELNHIGADLVAISPELTDSANKTSKDNILTFDILSDEDALLMKKFGIVFSLINEVKKLYDGFGIDLLQHNGNENNELPVPGVYIVNKDYEIVYRYLEEDYTKRMEPSEIIDVINRLKGGV